MHFGDKNTVQEKKDEPLKLWFVYSFIFLFAIVVLLTFGWAAILLIIFVFACVAGSITPSSS